MNLAVLILSVGGVAWVRSYYTEIIGTLFPQLETGRKAQQRDVCDILDRLQDANFNTVFLQVRMRGDVIWRSAIEPASKTFSGKYGMMPGYDPLAFVVVDELPDTGFDIRYHAFFGHWVSGKVRFTFQRYEKER